MNSGDGRTSIGSDNGGSAAAAAASSGSSPRRSSAASLSTSQRQGVEAVKAWLYRARCPWLIVFDNVEAGMASIGPYLPPAGHCGHVLVTSRVMSPEWADRCCVLDCFDPSESLKVSLSLSLFFSLLLSSSLFFSLLLSVCRTSTLSVCPETDTERLKFLHHAAGEAAMSGEKGADGGAVRSQPLLLFSLSLSPSLCLP